MKHHTRSAFVLSVAAAVFSSSVVLPTRLDAQVNTNDGDRANAARRAAVGAARGQVDAAQRQLTAATERIRAAFEADPAMVAAKKELDDARLELNRVSAPAYEKLTKSDEYKAAMKEEQDAKSRLTDEQAKTNATQPAATRPAEAPGGMARGTGTRTPEQDETALNVPLPSDEQVDAAADKAVITSKLHQMQEAAAKADPSTADAFKRYDAAMERSKALRLEIHARLLNDPEYKAAQERLNQAKAELVRASAANY